MFLFSYRVLVYDRKEEENKVKSGIIFGENFVKAIERLDKYYGDLEEIKGLKILCDAGAIELNEMTVRDIEEVLKDYI